MEVITELKGTPEFSIKSTFKNIRNTNFKQGKKFLGDNNFNKGQSKKISQKSIIKKLIPALTITAVSSMILMTIYEVVKQLLHPDITIWQSHMITIAFTTIVAPLSAYFALRKLEIARRLNQNEIEERKKIEKELIHARAQLELRVEERTAELTEKNVQLKNEIVFRKIAEINSRKSEERYKVMFEQMPFIVLHYNNSLEITEFNSFTSGIMGRRKEILKGFNLKDAQDKKIIPILKKALQGKEGYYEGLLLINNEEHYYQVRTVPYFGKDGNINGGIFMAENIDTRKLDENALIEAKEQAEKSEKLKTEFLAQMSHEIRTPLNTILNFTSLIETEIKSIVNTDLKDSFSVINSAGDRIIRTIDLLLNMSEIQTGQYKYSTRYFSVKESLTSVFNEHKHFAESKNLEYKFSIDIDDDVVVADDYSVSQIFVNLINNAIKYTHSGFVKIKLYRNREQRLIVDIEDSGVGISDKYKQNLFKPFTQEEQGYTRKYEGNGLGLALVEKYSELNNITIQVESKKNCGSLFRVIFP